MQEANQPPVPPNTTPIVDPIAVVPTPSPVVSGQVVPTLLSAKPSNNSCLIFAIIGCCAAFLVIPILVVIVIVAINPISRLRDAQGSLNQNNVRIAALSVSECIARETAKGTKTTIIYSNLGCASRGFLKQALYLTASNSAPLINTTITSNASYTKICIYAGQSSTDLVSWDSSIQVVTAMGKGTTSCI